MKKTMKKIRSNKEHPESLDGEMFFGNFTYDSSGLYDSELISIFKSFRKGEVAYNIVGEHDKSMSGYRPGFVNRKDFIENFNKLSADASRVYEKALKEAQS